MKQIVSLCAGILFYATTIAQTSYTLNYTPGAGNPGALNTDNDDIVATWTTLIGVSIATNQWSPSTPLPFAFNYFGNPVTDFKVSANGLVTFSTTTTLPNDNVALPSSGLTDSTIACFWDAFTTAPPTASNDIVAWKIWGTAPNRQLWIKWASYEIGAPKADNASFMCMLEEGTDKIYLVEGAYTNTATYTLAYTTTAGIQLNNTTAFMYQSPNRTRPASTTAPADNNVLTFTPYNKTSMSLVGVNSLQPNTNNIPKNGINEPMMRIDVNMNGELTPLNLTQIALNTSGTSVNTDITNARVFYSGSDSSFSTATQFGTTVTSPAASFNVNGTQVLKQGMNYFWVTYSISNSATTDNIADLECITVTVDGTPTAPAVSIPPGSRTIKPALSGTVAVGTGNTFVYLSDVFKEINANGLSGNTVISITSDIDDTATASLTYRGNYTLKIVPSADVLRNITGRFQTSLIELSGAQNVTIDGKGPVSLTGNYLRFLNKDEFGSTFNFINGARYDTIRNCVVEGVTFPLTKGVINLGTSSGGTSGVRYIHFLNNDIRNRSDSLGVPSILIYSAGTNTLNNGDFTISGNNMFNFRRSAIFIAFGDVNSGSFNITNNHMYYNTTIVAANGDIVPIMFTPGVNSENNIISGNYIGGQAPFCGGSAWTSFNDVYWVAMNINSGFATGTSVQGNTIQNINDTLSTAKDFVAIRFESGKINIGTITGNIIGHPTIPNSIRTSLAGLTMGIYGIYTSGEFTIQNNIIANIVSFGTANTVGLRGIAVQRGGGSFTVSNNTIFNLTTSSAQTTPSTNALLGIGMLSTAEHATTIRNNKIYNLSTTSTTIAVHPSAIVLDQSTSASGLIEGNIIYGINNVSTAAATTLNGMNILGGVKNWIIRNNMIALTNGSNTNPMTIRGIADNNAGNNNSYYNNTIYIGGSAASGALNSYAFIKVLNSVTSLRNNILYNERTGGTGFHAAVASALTTNWNANTSGYNLLVAQNPASVGYWGTAAQTFAQWQTSSTGDKTSWSDLSANVPSATFFKNLASGDLSIDSNNALCWYANGKGIALANNSTDIHGQNRSISIITGSTDIGADEFPTTTLPPFATVSGNIVTTDSSIFTFAGRTIARVVWNSGTYPASVSLRYYTGSNPPAATVQKYFNSYYQFSENNPGVYDANIRLFYDSALFGTVSAPASLEMATYTSSWNHNTATIVDATEQSFRVHNISALNTYTGTDASLPLPVKLIVFNGVVKSTDANLFWQTASELNAQAYEIERSYNGTEFKTVGRVKAFNKASKYEFMDLGAFSTNTIGYYRLKMLDNDGTAAYSNTIKLQTKTNTLEASVYPNPYTSETSLSFTNETETPAIVTISDMQGKTVWSNTIQTQTGTNTISLDLTNQKPGMYFVNITMDGRSFQTKLIK